MTETKKVEPAKTEPKKDEQKVEAKKDEKKVEAKKDDELVMEYRMLGGTGLKVSCLGFGVMSIDSTDQCLKLMKACRPNKNGINFFDNAELYGEPVGMAEKHFGDALKQLQKQDPKLWRRSELVITTKLFWGEADGTVENSPKIFMGISNHGPNESGLSRKHLFEGMKDSLKRLSLDYVDVIYAHRSCAYTPMEEIVRGFNAIIERGQALYWGTSMWPTHKIIEAYWVAKINKLIPPCVEQPIYNMFTRDIMENHYKPIFEYPYNIGTTVFMPLDAGYLTGKYIGGIPKGSRFDKDTETGNRLSKWWSQIDQTKVDKSKKLLDVAKELNVSLVQLALGWCLKNKNVSCLILGGTKPYQITQNLGCVKVAAKITKDDMKKIEDVLQYKVVTPWARSVVGTPLAKKIIDTC